MKPLVTVIAIAYNHEAYIKEALESLWAQDYEALQVIVMDDASKDNSQQLIQELINEREAVTFIGHDTNRGYTSTFNEGLSMARGEFVIDFALDDVMLPGFIAKSVEALQTAGEAYGVVFSDADYIDEHSKVTGNHYQGLKEKGMIDQMPEDDIFEMVLKRYFICTPTMVIRKSVLDRIGGYDEQLAYEDFDFWVRSSRYFKYRYLDQSLMQKRKLNTSMSANRLRHWQNEQLDSVFRVCEKAFALCKTRKELKALRSRLAYEYRQCLRVEYSAMAGQYLQLLRKAGGNPFLSRIYRVFRRAGIDFRRA